MSKVSKLSSRDLGQVLKNVHDERSGTLRMANSATLAPQSYDRNAFTYDASDCLIRTEYYENIAQEIVQIKAVKDTAGSLGGKYFNISGAHDKELFYVWYNVDAGSADPAPAGRTGIEVNISSGDSANLVATLTEISLRNLYGTRFDSDISKNVIGVEYLEWGPTTGIVDVDTGFTMEQIQAGDERFMKVVVMTYDANGSMLTAK
jgi:hypothetical protein